MEQGTPRAACQPGGLSALWCSSQHTAEDTPQGVDFKALAQKRAGAFFFDRIPLPVGKKTPWEEMQEGRRWAEEHDYVWHVFEPRVPPPRPPERVGPWWFRDGLVEGRKWHYAKGYRGSSILAACNKSFIDCHIEWDQSPKIQNSCTWCLRRLAKLPPGRFPDDPEPTSSDD